MNGVEEDSSIKIALLNSNGCENCSRYLPFSYCTNINGKIPHNPRLSGKSII